MQGVTTDVCGLCGYSPAPIGQDNLEEYVKRKEYRLPDASPIRPCSFAEYRDQMNRSGNATNMALFVGNANLRVDAVGYGNRAASPGELDRMKGMLRESMEAGAYGLSTGLTYVPSMFASREAVSYTHLDVYKRQVKAHQGPDARSQQPARGLRLLPPVQLRQGYLRKEKAGPPVVKRYPLRGMPSLQ